MTFAAPLALAGLALLPLYAWLRASHLRPAEVPVSSLLLWEKIAADPAAARLSHPGVEPPPGRVTEQRLPAPPS